MEVNKLALESYDVLLYIGSYISIIDYKIDPFMLDNFWQSVSENERVNVDTLVLEWLGYANEKDSNRK